MVELRNKKLDLLYERKISRKNAIIFTELKENEKISIMYDPMFKTMFYSESRLKYSCKFLSYYLDIEYQELLKNIHLAKNELDKKHENEKGERCDYVANINGSTINIEVNTSSNVKNLERNMEYAYRLFARLVKRNHRNRKSGKEEVDSVRYQQVIQFNINNFSFHGNDKTIDVYTIQNDNAISLTDKLIFVQIYIPNLRTKWYNQGIKSLTEAEKYLLGLVEPEIEKAKLLGEGNSIMEEYITDAYEASRYESFGESYDKELAFREEAKREGHEDGWQEGYEEGREEGLEQGRVDGLEQGRVEGLEQGHEEERLKNARELLKNKVDKEIVIKSLGLTKEELEQIISEVNN